MADRNLQLLEVMLTEAAGNAPGEIREFHARLLRERQAALHQAFWWLFSGLIAGFVMISVSLEDVNWTW